MNNVRGFPRALTLSGGEERPVGDNLNDSELREGEDTDKSQ